MKMTEIYSNASPFHQYSVMIYVLMFFLDEELDLIFNKNQVKAPRSFYT